jgi:SAM-dependent methyltransferase
MSVERVNTPAIPDGWSDSRGRALYPIAFPDLAVPGDVFVPSPGSFLMWRHLQATAAGKGGRCLDVGCGSGLQTIQLALNGARHVHGIDVDRRAAEVTLTNAWRNGVANHVTTAAADLFEWEPGEPFDVVVASLFQAPVDPRKALGSRRPPDFWGRKAVDRLFELLPDALTPSGVAYVLHLSFLSRERTSTLLDELGLQARVADFAFYPFNEAFDACADQIARVEELSDAHHLRIGDTDVAIAYLLEVTRQ